jgi:lipoyl(octanoyl) transferase
MQCHVEQLGLVSYADGLRLQGELVAQRNAGTIPDTLLLLEHPHVYTLGRNAKKENLLLSAAQLAARGAQVFEIDRGGDVTYHGPGQLVGYPILDLGQHRRDIAWYMRSLEEVLIAVAGEYGIDAGRLARAPGVWVGRNKLAALGVHISRWVTSHGFAFNVNTDLRYFDGIVPCGLRDKGVTSLEKLLGRRVEMEEVALKAVRHFGRVFGLEMVEATAVPAGLIPRRQPTERNLALPSGGSRARKKEPEPDSSLRSVESHVIPAKAGIH